MPHFLLTAIGIGFQEVDEVVGILALGIEDQRFGGTTGEDIAAQQVARHELGCGITHRLEPLQTESKACRQILQPTDILVADANTGWTQHEAARVVSAVRDVDVYIEQPCTSYDECLSVRRRTALPFVLDEIIGDVEGLLRALDDDAMDVINLKISKVGGLTKAKLIRDLCVQRRIPMTIEDTWGGDLVTAAVSHLAASVRPEALFTVSFMNDWTNEHVAGYEPRSVNGYGSAPTGPGLGITVDPSTLGAPIITAQ